MLSATISFAMHLFVSSFQGIRALRQTLEYFRPYSNMAAVKGKINFNTRHLAKGDPLPPYNGKLRVYNMRYCPFAQRTILALNAKELDYEVVNIDLIDKPEWLYKKSAFLKVPALEIADGVSIYESLVTVEYLDDVYPHRPLLPKDPVKKAFDKILVETSGPIHSMIFKLVKSPETITADVVSGFFKALDFIQDELQKRGTTFLDGELPGYADYMIWPWFERIRVHDDPRIQMDANKYKSLSVCRLMFRAAAIKFDSNCSMLHKLLCVPTLLVYIENMLKDPAVSQYLLTKENFRSFHSAFGLGKKPNYNELLEE